MLPLPDWIKKTCFGNGMLAKVVKKEMGGSDGKESACNAGDLGLIPGLGRSPGEGMATHFSIVA